MVLSQARDFAKQLCDFQEQMMVIREDLNAIHYLCIRWGSAVVLDPSTRIDGTSWAEEVDISDPIEDEDDASSSSCDEVRLVDVGPQMEDHLKRSFVLMKNTNRYVPHSKNSSSKSSDVLPSKKSGAIQSSHLLPFMNAK